MHPGGHDAHEQPPRPNRKSPQTGRTARRSESAPKDAPAPRKRRPQPVHDKPAGWNPQAQWYDELVGQHGSDHHQHVILPAVLRLLGPLRPADRLLDLCCGQGILARALAEAACLPEYVGVDASPALIARARERSGDLPACSFRVGDARRLSSLQMGRFSHAACILALHDLDPMDPVFAGLAAHLRPGGRAVCVVMHPAFRIPRQARYRWDPERRIQTREIDAYLTPVRINIVNNPGAAAAGARPKTNPYYHRPLAAYINTAARSGLLLCAMEELSTHRRVQAGERAAAENHAREQFPMFLAMAFRATA